MHTSVCTHPPQRLSYTPIHGYGVHTKIIHLSGAVITDPPKRYATRNSTDVTWYTLRRCPLHQKNLSRRGVLKKSDYHGGCTLHATQCYYTLVHVYGLHTSVIHVWTVQITELQKGMQPKILRMLPGTLYVGVRYTQKIFPVEQYQKKVHTMCFFSARHPVQLLLVVQLLACAMFFTV